MKTNTKTNLKGTSQTRRSAKSEAVHAPVSYTHLDVYKRQRINHFGPNFSNDCFKLVQLGFTFQWSLYIIESLIELVKQYSWILKSELQRLDWEGHLKATLMVGLVA